MKKEKGKRKKEKGKRKKEKGKRKKEKGKREKGKVKRSRIKRATFFLRGPVSQKFVKVHIIDIKR
jgi:hypothetical protein